MIKSVYLAWKIRGRYLLLVPAQTANSASKPPKGNKSYRIFRDESGGHFTSRNWSIIIVALNSVEIHSLLKEILIHLYQQKIDPDKFCSYRPKLGNSLLSHRFLC